MICNILHKYSDDPREFDEGTRNDSESNQLTQLECSIDVEKTYF